MRHIFFLNIIMLVSKYKIDVHKHIFILESCTNKRKTRCKHVKCRGRRPHHYDGSACVTNSGIIANYLYYINSRKKPKYVTRNLTQMFII